VTKKKETVFHPDDNGAQLSLRRIKMNYKLPLALMICSACAVNAAEQPQVWRAIAFGQSTDVNFASNVLPEKVGVNDVTIAGKILEPEDAADLTKPVVIGR